MGKASREKRERRDGTNDASTSTEQSTTRRQPVSMHDSGRAAGGGGLPWFWIVIGLIVLGGLLAAFVTRPSQDEKKQADKIASLKLPDYADVKVDGAKLPDFPATEGAADKAVGKTVPKVSGVNVQDKKQVTYPLNDGKAMMIAVVAHWCPHCNNEVPKIVQLAKDGGVPKGIELAAISTSVDPSAPNYPADKWLASENWTWPTIIDDEAGTAAQALGTQGFPFLVFVNADGTVAYRHSGEWDIKEVKKKMAEVAKTATTTSSSKGSS